MSGGNANKVRLLILAKDLDKYQKAAQFLTRRGWSTDAVSSIKQAVEFVVKYRPTFVLVSMSHPNPNVFKLPNLLMQTFNASCIAFGESSDTKTLQKLNTCKLKYVFHGAMSGPSIHMRIKKILLDEETERERIRQAAMNPQPNGGAEGNLGPQTESNDLSHNNSVSVGNESIDYSTSQAATSVEDSSFSSEVTEPGESPFNSFPGGEGDEEDLWAKKKSYGSDGEPEYIDYTEQKTKFGADSEYEGHYEHREGHLGGDAGEYSPGHVDDYPKSMASSDDQMDSHDYSRAAHLDSHGYSESNMDIQTHQGGKLNIAYMPTHGQIENNEADFSPSGFSGASETSSDPIFSSELEGAVPGMSHASDQSTTGIGFMPEGSSQSLSQPAEEIGSSTLLSSFGESPFQQAKIAYEEQLKQTGYMPQDEVAEVPSPASLEKQSFTAVGDGHFSPFNDIDPSQGFAASTLENNRQKNGNESENDGPIIRKGGNKLLEFDFDPSDPFVNPGDMFFDPKKISMNLSKGSHYTIPPSLIAEPNFLLDNTGQLPDIEEGEEEIECNVVFRDGLRPDQHLKAIAAVVDSGFKSACRPDASDPLKIRKPSTVGIITARYDNKMGYILVALPQDCEDTEGFLAKIKSSIESQKHVKDVEIRLHAEFYSHIEPVEFVDWANNFAEFVSTFQHRDMEVAMAFVATSELPDIRKADDKEGMYVVAIENIVPDIPVNYVGYINLKKNDKMIQYIKDGRSISAVQKERLKDKHVETIYISEKDTDKFKAHFASALLNQLIQQYNNSLSQRQAESA